MTTKDAALLYLRAGFAPPDDMWPMNHEYIRNTRRKAVDGIEFRSTLEADCYQLLKAWQAAGAIRRLELQPKFLLQPAFRRDKCDYTGRPKGPMVRAITYKADFRFERDGGGTLGWETVVVEAKGFRTQAYELRRKLFLGKFPDIRYEIWNREKLRELTK